MGQHVHKDAVDVVCAWWMRVRVDGAVLLGHADSLYDSWTRDHWVLEINNSNVNRACGTVACLIRDLVAQNRADRRLGAGARDGVVNAIRVEVCAPSHSNICCREPRPRVPLKRLCLVDSRQRTERRRSARAKRCLAIHNESRSRACGHHQTTHQRV